MERKNYTVAIDLGSSSVVVAVGEKTAEGLLDVVCAVSKPVEGVHAGKIENIELVSRAVSDAVAEAEEQCGIHIMDSKLAGEINKALGELKKNGEYDKIYKKWFGEAPKEK